ncbi:hypothetical protein [Flexibacterium corallicola]|uniref:hypothetical protein n=1 Tax=Flexibacterium corallicola TaxID=3037259 RepID=UPI00286EBBD1|nr:hypothetical protein [Pseudovibrio sp. M1P-2-3]
MDQDWILHRKETRRFFSKATWIPLRESICDEKVGIKEIGYIKEYKGCGSVAFPPGHRELAEKLSWRDIGISCNTGPYAYDDGDYSPVEQYEYNNKEPIGFHLVFEYVQPVVGRRQWILNPDLVIALGLIKEGTNWVRPEENFIVVAREVLNESGDHCLIEIKREFLIDYLAARNLSLRLSYYRERVENVASLEGSPYANLESISEQRNNGRFELRVNQLESIFGRSFALFRAWRTDVDEEDDAPVMGPENDNNTDYESSKGYRGGYEGMRVEGGYWRDEWIEHQEQSTRVRGDADKSLPQFITETDGTRMASSELDNDESGRWLWFRSSVVNELLSLRGFSLRWCTLETGVICSTSSYETHFGINQSDLITVYAADIARLASWEQHIWAAHNVVPDGKVSLELLDAQVKIQPASTEAVEVLFFEGMEQLEMEFDQVFNISLFSRDVDKVVSLRHISRFESKDQASLLRLAKELVRVFSERLNVSELRKISTHSDKNKFGSNKLLQDILAQNVGADIARSVFGPIVGAYDMRVGDAHPTSSKIGEALKLAGVDEGRSYMRQGEQLISNVGEAIWNIGKLIHESRIEGGR